MWDAPDEEIRKSSYFLTQEIGGRPVGTGSTYRSLDAVAHGLRKLVYVLWGGAGGGGET